MNDTIIDIGNDIIKQVDIVEIIQSFIKVTKKGKDYVAICPFHNDTNPSLHISPEKQIFKCFVCGVGGNAIQFVKLYKNCSYIEALKTVCQIAGIHDERLEKNINNSSVNSDTKNVLKCLNSISNYYNVFLFQTDEGKSTALKYLHDRGLDDATIEKFKIGYSLKDNEKITERLIKDGFSIKTIEKTGIGSIHGQTIRDNNFGRVIFGITNEDGEIVGFSARQLIEDKEHGKYINSPETAGGVFHKSSILYNYYNAQLEARRGRYIYIVEGFMDAIALDRAGIKSVVALMGTALTKDHIRMLKMLNCEVRLCLDNDNAGQDAMIKCARLLKANNVKTRFVSNDQELLGKDCDEILNKAGSDALNRYLENLISEGEFILNYYAKRYDLNSLANKQALINNFIPFLCSLNDKLEVEFYVNKLSSVTSFSPKAIYEQIKLAKEPEEIVDTNISGYQENIPVKRKLDEKRQLSRLENCEKTILKYMLDDEEAVKQFDTGLGYFTNNVYQEISNIIQDYLSKYSGQYCVANIVNYVNLFDGNIKDDMRQKMLDEITTISIENLNYPPYTKEQMDECLKIIEETKKLYRDKEVFDETSRGKSNAEKAEAARRLIEERRKALKK